jgi:hypothetical protein
MSRYRYLPTVVACLCSFPTWYFQVDRQVSSCIHVSRVVSYDEDTDDEPRAAKVGRRKSWAWGHFNHKTCKLGKTVTLHCKHCPVELSYAHNTTGMISHLRSIHPDEFVAVALAAGMQRDADGRTQEVIGVKVRVYLINCFLRSSCSPSCLEYIGMSNHVDMSSHIDS